MRWDEVNTDQRASIVQLRKRMEVELAKMPEEYGENFSLLRWLMGWDYDIDKIVPKMTWSMSVIRNLNLHRLQLDTVDKVNSYVNGCTQVAEYYPGGLMSQDRDGNVVIMGPLARAAPRSLVKCGRVSEMFILALAECEGAYQIVRRCERESNRKLGMKVIVDLDGFNMDLIYKPTVDMYINLLALLQAVFPDFALRIFVVNAPSVVQMLYGLVQHVLSKQTKAKIQIVGLDWQQRLRDDIGAENIFPQWGGSKAHEKATGWIRMGGIPPMSLMYNPDTSNDEPAPSSLTELNISRRASSIVPIQIDHVPAQLTWYFRSSENKGGDIDFSIMDSNNEEVWPRFRLSTEFVPERGQLRCNKTGQYKLLFDNSHSLISAKTIKYRIDVITVF